MGRVMLAERGKNTTLLEGEGEQDEGEASVGGFIPLSASEHGAVAEGAGRVPGDCEGG